MFVNGYTSYIITDMRLTEAIRAGDLLAAESSNWNSNSRLGWAICMSIFYFIELNMDGLPVSFYWNPVSIMAGSINFNLSINSRPFNSSVFNRILWRMVRPRSWLTVSHTDNIHCLGWHLLLSPCHCCLLSDWSHSPILSPHWLNTTSESCVNQKPKICKHLIDPFPKISTSRCGGVVNVD